MNKLPHVRRNLWALMVLGLLRERPTHPYEMQHLIRQRGKDELLDLKRGSLYHAIDRLERAGLIEAIETSREGRRPERTTYRITQEGIDTLLAWMRDILSRPGRDSSEFVAAIAHLPHLPPEEAADLLTIRAGLLQAEIARLDSVLEAFTPRLGRVVLLETDLARAMKRAELAWVNQLVADLRSGVHHWDIEEILRHPGMTPGAPAENAGKEGR